MLTRAAAWPAVTLGGALVLVGYAIFQGGATLDNALMWLGGGALALSLLALATQGPPVGARTLVPLAALAIWFGVTIAWSTAPDYSWEYADRALLYLLVATLGLWLASRTRELAIGLAVVFAATALWSLAGKVVPFLPSSSDAFARLNEPVDLWNQLALLGSYALALALWIASGWRIRGSLLAYLWIVVLVLTVSRGGIVLAVIVVLAWTLLSGDAVDALATLVAAAIPGGLVGGLAFTLPAVTSTSASHASRWHQGLLFGAMLLAGAALCTALTRLPRPELTPTLRRRVLAAAAMAALALVVLVAVNAQSLWDRFTSTTEIANSSGRLVSLGSNFRWAWWTRAWHVFTLHPLEGTGAGTFWLSDLLYRTTYLDATPEPHNIALQLLSETGAIGFVLLVATVTVLVVAGGRRRGHELALSLIFPAFVLHALIDIDWDFVAVAVPAFLVAGALAGRSARPRRPSPSAVLLAGGVALALFACLLLPWLGNRWATEAQNDMSSSQALATAEAAHSVDPFLLLPLQVEAENQPHTVAGARIALSLYRTSTTMQPDNPYTWLDLGQLELDLGCPVLAFPALDRYTDLDDQAYPEDGADLKLKALAYIESGKRDPAACAAYSG